MPIPLNSSVRDWGIELRTEYLEDHGWDIATHFIVRRTWAAFHDSYEAGKGGHWHTLQARLARLAELTGRTT